MTTPGSTADHTSTVYASRSSDAATPDPGATLGRYLVIAKLGQGGMGVVLRGYDPKLQREVALKVLKTGAMSEEAQARMVREARAMARLNHPNVVAVYDVELEAEGGVLLAMELVEGHTLRDWLKQPQAWREVVERFRQAGRGLAAAHAAGLLHRDFKPSNVLVGEDGRVRVTDFGLARAQGATTEPEDPEVGTMSSRDSLSGELTEAGVVLGTFAYMAPEQHTGEELEPHADQYAFCASLWEGLTGKKPYVGRERAVLKAKCTGPPQWPRDVTVPRRVVKALMRGLAPQPTGRWPSMEALLDELDPMPHSRRRRTLIVLGVLGLGGLAGLGLFEREGQRCSGAEAQLADAWDGARREAVEQAVLETGVVYAADVWSRIGPRLEDYGQAWMQMHTDACRATTIRGEQSAEIMDLRMTCLHRAKVELAAVVAVLGAPDDDILQKAHEMVSGLPSLERCADVQGLQADVPPPSEHEVEAVERVRETLAQAKAFEDAGKYDAASEALERAIQDAESVTYGPLGTDVTMRRASLQQRRGQYRESEASYEEAFGAAVSSGRWRAAGAAARELTSVVGSQAKYPEAMVHADIARALVEHGGDPVERASLSRTIGTVLTEQGKYAEAEVEHRAALAIWGEIAGPGDTRAASARVGLANALERQGKLAEAEAEARAALAILESALGSTHPSVGGSRNNLADMLRLQGKYPEAEAEARAALAIWENALGPDNPKIAIVRHNLGSALSGQREHAAAEAEIRAALAIWKKHLGPDHPNVGGAHNAISAVLCRQGKWAEAEPEMRAALAISEKVLGSDHLDVALYRHNLADVIIELGELDEATRLFEQAWEVRKGDKTLPAERADTAFALADILWKTKADRKRARALAERAREDYVAAGPEEAKRLAKVEAWIAERR